MENNIILLTDSYKVTHWKQYPPKTETVYSYFESRGGKFRATKFFGLQYFLKKYLQSARVTQAKINDAEYVFGKHLGDPALFNRAGWEYILHKHHGRLPVRIKAVPEGTVVPTGHVLMTIENTDPKCFWLTNYLETLLVQVWYPTTVCTLSHFAKEMILDYLNNTGDPAGIDFKLHDFGFRGVSSVESAGLGGLAHIVNFLGTDTVAALTYAKRYYNSDVSAFSIPASEHSTITAWGVDNEVQAYNNMLEQYPKGLVACVSDSYNIFNACKNIWGRQLRDRVLARDGVLIVRPDSGDPANVVLEVLTTLGDAFGYNLNDQGYKVLNNKVRVIQGDGCDYEKINEVLNTMKMNRWSADNIAFGMGGGLLQKLNRDTQSFAFKCSAIQVDGRWRDVYKQPITDAGKNSKRGKLSLVKDALGAYQTVGHNISMGPANLSVPDLLQTVFENGKIVKEYTLDEVKHNGIVC